MSKKVKDTAREKDGVKIGKLDVLNRTFEEEENCPIAKVHSKQRPKLAPSREAFDDTPLHPFY